MELNELGKEMGFDLGMKIFDVRLKEKYHNNIEKNEINDILNEIIIRFSNNGYYSLIGLCKPDMIFILNKFNQHVLTKLNKEEVKNQFANFLWNKKNETI